MNDLLKRREMFSEGNSRYIQFADPEVERICVANFSSDGIGVTYEDAAAVRGQDIGNKFKNNTSITTFNELEYFTGAAANITSISFNNCTNLTSVSIPEGSTRIPNFNGCSSLTTVHFPSTLTYFDVRYFEGANIQHVYIKDLRAWLSVEIFANGGTSGWYRYKHMYLNGVEITGELVIPDGTITVGQNCFTGCTEITSVVFPNTVTHIGTVSTGYYDSSTVGLGVFSGCTNLTTVTWPSSLQFIGYRAFANTNLSGQLNLPSSVTSIGGGAFRESKISGPLVIDSNIVTLYRFAFSKCTGITSLQFAPNSSLTTIGPNVFQGCSNITNEISLPSSLTALGDTAFDGSGITGTFTVPSFITSGKFVPGALDGITTLIVPEGITEFAGRVNQTTGYLELPSTITILGTNYVSGYGPGKTTVIKATSVPTGMDRFLTYFKSGQKFYVPYSADDSILNAYKAAITSVNAKNIVFSLNPDGTIPTS